MLEFDAARHEYRQSGRVVPSVTQVLAILQDFGAVPADVLDRAAEFGRHVHAAIEFDIRGDLDEDSLDPALAPRLARWREFVADVGARNLRSEIRVYHHALRYAGTLDVLAEIEGRDCVIDIKTGAVPRTVGPQTAAYLAAMQTSERLTRPRRYCVALTDTAYHAQRLTDPADWSIFQSCLNVWRYRNAT